MFSGKSRTNTISRIQGNPSQIVPTTPVDTHNLDLMSLKEYGQTFQNILVLCEITVVC